MRRSQSVEYKSPYAFAIAGSCSSPPSMEEIEIDGIGHRLMPRIVGMNSIRKILRQHVRRIIGIVEHRVEIDQPVEYRHPDCANPLIVGKAFEIDRFIAATP